MKDSFFHCSACLSVISHPKHELESPRLCVLSWSGGWIQGPIVSRQSWDWSHTLQGCTHFTIFAVLLTAITSSSSHSSPCASCGPLFMTTTSAERRDVDPRNSTGAFTCPRAKVIGVRAV